MKSVLKISLIIPVFLTLYAYGSAKMASTETSVQGTGPVLAGTHHNSLTQNIISHRPSLTKHLHEAEKEPETQNDSLKEINWYSFEASTKLTETKRKYFIYVYTDWCSWCKRMKGSTFENPEIISLLNEKFIPVMFNAESNEVINFRGKDFGFISNGRRGYHELAATLLNNRLSYPSVVFLDEKMDMIQPLPGYLPADELKIILHFLGDNIYEEMGFEEYYESQTKD